MLELTKIAFIFLSILNRMLKRILSDNVCFEETVKRLSIINENIDWDKFLNEHVNDDFKKFMKSIKSLVWIDHTLPSTNQRSLLEKYTEYYTIIIKNSLTALKNKSVLIIPPCSLDEISHNFPEIFLEELNVKFEILCKMLTFYEINYKLLNIKQKLNENDENDENGKNDENDENGESNENSDNNKNIIISLNEDELVFPTGLISYPYDTVSINGCFVLDLFNNGCVSESYKDMCRIILSIKLLNKGVGIDELESSHYCYLAINTGSIKNDNVQINEDDIISKRIDEELIVESVKGGGNTNDISLNQKMSEAPLNNDMTQNGCQIA